MTALTSMPSVVLAAGIVILAISAIKKLWANITIRTGQTKLAGLEIADWLVILTEFIVIGIGVWIPFPYSNLLIGLYFLALLTVASLLRGTQCNCFGISENSIDKLHLSLLAIISSTNLVSILVTDPSRSTGSVLLGLLAGGFILIMWQRKRTSRPPKFKHSLPDDREIDFEGVSEITILTQQGCNSCRVLKSIIEDRDFFVPLVFEDEKHSDLARAHRIASFPTALVYFHENSAPPQSRQLNGITEIIGFLAKGQR